MIDTLIDVMNNAVQSASAPGAIDVKVIHPTRSVVVTMHLTGNTRQARRIGYTELAFADNPALRKGLTPAYSRAQVEADFFTEQYAAFTDDEPILAVQVA